MTSKLKSRPQVLLVDNNVKVLNSLAKLLQNTNCDIHKASDGMEAFELALRINLNLIISELFLPGMDGNELVKQVRHLSYGKQCVFIFLTDSISEDMQVQSMGNGADDIIIKPIKPAIFKMKIDSILTRIAEEQEVQRKRFRANIGSDLGEIIFCRAAESCELIDQLELNVNEAYTFEEFDGYMSSKNIWMIFIDDKAEWALCQMSRIVQNISPSTPIWLLASRRISEAKQLAFIENGGFGVLTKYKNPDILIHQIEVLIDREISVKNQYVSSIRQAVLASPVHFLPQHDEDYPSFSIHIKYEPYVKPAGGDFYEIVKLENGNTLILIGDVMGKKWGAWFFANAYLAYIRASLKVFPTQRKLETDNNLGLLISEINQFLYKDIQLSDAFTTLTAILIIPRLNQVKISSAGAIYPIFYSYQERKSSIIPVNGKILGIVSDEKYSSETISTQPGDKIILVTDGYTEAFNATNGRQVGISKVASTLELPLFKGITNLDKLEQALMTSNSINAFNDDRTLLLVDFK